MSLLTKNGAIITAITALLLAGCQVSTSQDSKGVTQNVTAKKVEPQLPPLPTEIRGIHLSAWAAGTEKTRALVEKYIEGTEINTIVIGIKEHEGKVYIPGVATADKIGAYQETAPDIQEYLKYLRSKGVYTIARIVVFKDKYYSKSNPKYAVKTPAGEVWTDRRGVSWSDPYQKVVWDYNIEIAKRAVELGFNEIQWDYIRFPSDGPTKLCRYSYAQHNSSSSAYALVNFLKYSREQLAPLGAKVSIDVFGLTPSVQHDMGIGQKIVLMTNEVDYVSPMCYPSHYAKGEYGLPYPNAEPYKTVYRSVSDGIARIPTEKMRPYLQDFSMGYKYGAFEIRSQIQATYDAGVKSWLLWDPNCKYTQEAFCAKNADPVQCSSTTFRKMLNTRGLAYPEFKRKVTKKVVTQPSSAQVMKSTDIPPVLDEEKAK
ncbi:MAG: putative glycoside hydrolase [Elusimicrobiota bacterium]